MTGSVLKVLFALFFHCATASINLQYYPRYHLAPPHGWMNDPNGFTFFRNYYHLFYQYNPETSQAPGIAHWGHAQSKDLFHWEHLPISMYPDKGYDKTGVFSGSGIVENDTMYLFYTGNVNHPNATPDHEQHQALAICTDGVNVTKYENNPIIEGADHQPNLRDPKVWKHNDTYYMVLGNSFNNGTLGRVLLYTSKDMISWKEVSILDQSDGSLGYMWECPDFFELDGRFILMFSPQGVKAEGDKYKNLYQCGYFVGTFDYETNKFKSLTKFMEADHGHDFYATQTIENEAGQRIVIAWFDMWENNYPERNDGWTGMMTIPRVLSLTPDNRLIQKPVHQISNTFGQQIYKGRPCTGEIYTIPDNSAMVRVIASNEYDFKLFVESQNANNSVQITYDSEEGHVTLNRGGEDGIRRTEWHPSGKVHWTVFIDASSIELFCGEGEVTFSSRFFPDGPVHLRLGDYNSIEELEIRAMKRTIQVNEEQNITKLVISL